MQTSTQYYNFFTCLCSLTSKLAYILKHSRGDLPEIWQGQLKYLQSLISGDVTRGNATLTLSLIYAASSRWYRQNIRLLPSFSTYPSPFICPCVFGANL